MKKVFSAFLAVAMLFACASCTKSNETPEDASAIIAAYSIKSENGEFIVEVQNLGGVYDDLYDTNGIYIKFDGGNDNIYDSDGNKISRKDLNYGDSLQIYYSGKLAKKNPKTIEAYKIVKIA